MNSEKVKEIKALLRCMNGEKGCTNCYINEIAQEQETCCINIVADILTLINELESENEKLKNIGLNEEMSVGEYLQENQELKDRIAELEKEIEENAFYAKGYADGIKNTYEFVMPDKLTQFAKMLKKKIVSMKWAREDTNEKLIKQGATIKAIDETLKECL